MLANAFYHYDSDGATDSAVSRALPGSGRLVKDLVAELHDNQREHIEQEIAKMQMLSVYVVGNSYLCCGAHVVHNI